MRRGNFASKLIGLQSSFLECKYFVPTKRSVEGEKKPTRKFFNISEILESMKLYEHVIELRTYFKYANLFNSSLLFVGPFPAVSNRVSRLDKTLKLT